MKLIDHIRAIEGLAYPRSMQMLQDCQSWGDLVEYCEGRPTVEVWDGGYIIVTRTEIVDLASVKALSFRDLRNLIEFLRDHFRGRTVSFDARETTSWRLIQFAARRGWVTVISADPWDWDGETFFSATVVFSR